MTRITASNVIKMIAAFMFIFLVAFYVLLIGLAAKNKKVIIEGIAYAVIFVVFVSFPESSTAAAFLGLASMAAAAIRSYQLRDLWLPRKNSVPNQDLWAQGQPPSVQWAQNQPLPAQWAQNQPPSNRWVQNQPSSPAPFRSSPPPQAAPIQTPEDLSSALSWASSTAKQNKYRLPSEAYIMILEIYQTLDATIDENRRKPSNDAGFEYELDALVREYLPAVLNAYLAIAPSIVDSDQPNGRTPNQELIEQLGLLHGQAETLHSSRHSQTSAELSTTGNFLRQRFDQHTRGAFDFGIE